MAHLSKNHKTVIYLSKNGFKIEDIRLILPKINKKDYGDIGKYIGKSATIVWQNLSCYRNCKATQKAIASYLKVPYKILFPVETKT